MHNLFQHFFSLAFFLILSSHSAHAYNHNQHQYVPTPTSNPTPTIIVLTPTPTLLSSPTPAPTVTIAPTATPTAVPTMTPTPTVMPSDIPSPTPTDTPTPTPTPFVSSIGNDISYPQCGKSFPTGQEFAIVGVNGGIATTTNPCLSTQLSWANTSSGLGGQTKVQLYVNTGNPGGLNTASWPKNNTDPEGNVSNNPYGTCDGSDSQSCAWQYGWNRAVDDVQSKFTPAAQSAGLAVDPSLYPWWLDVETVNSWKDGSDEAYQSNVADLEGMVTYLQSRGIKVGLYATRYQWGIIIKNLSAGSNLNGLNSWLPGAQTADGAKANCSESPLTTNGNVTMTQYTASSFDYDYSCI